MKYKMKYISIEFFFIFLYTPRGASGQAGIGYFPVTRADKVLGKECQHLVQDKVWVGTVWRKYELAGWWEWDSKLGLDGRMVCQGRSPGSIFGKQTSI